MEVTKDLRAKLHETITIVLEAYAEDEHIDAQIVDAIVEVLAKEDMGQPQQVTAIKYDGKREEYSDGLFETGVWKKSQVKLVPNVVAVRMLEHPDVYVIADNAPPVNAETIVMHEKTDDTEQLQQVRDAVLAMTTPQAIADFVATNYNGLKIPATYKKINSMQRFAIQQIDLYGIPA